MPVQRALRAADLPAVWFTLAVMLGVGCALFVPLSVALVTWVSGGVMMVALALLLFSKSRSTGVFVAYTAISLLVCARAESVIGRAERDLLTAFESDTVIVSCRGVVVWKDLGRGGSRSERLWLSHPRIRHEEREFASDELLLTLSLPLANSVSVEIGDAVACEARLHPTHQLQLRSARDVTWTLRHRVLAEARLARAETLAIVSGKPGLRSIVHRARQAISGILRENLSPDAAAIAGALLLGSRETFASEFSQDLQANGLAHLFALSGLNTGLIVSLAWLLLGLAQVPARWRYVLLLMVLTCYAVLGLGVPSLFRSSLMAGLFIFGRLIAKQTHPANLLLVAAGVELFVWPLHLLDAGFLLSYLSMAGILAAYVVLSKPMQELIGKRRGYGVARRAGDVLSSTAGAQLATAPVVALLFGRTPALAVLSNVVAIPLFSLLLVLILLFLLFHSLLPVAADPVAQAINGIVWGFALVSKSTASIPAASFLVQGPPLLLLAGLAFQVAGIIYLWRGALKRGAFFSLICLNILVWSPMLAPRADADVTAIGDERDLSWFLRVGENSIAADCGPAWSAARSAQAMRSELARLGEADLNALLIFDRRVSAIGGADEIIAATRPAAVVDVSSLHETQASDLLDAAVVLSKSRYLSPNEGDVLELSDARIKVLRRDQSGISSNMILIDHPTGITLFLSGDFDSSVCDFARAAAGKGNLLIIPMDEKAANTAMAYRSDFTIATNESGVRWQLRNSEWTRIESTGKSLMRMWSLPGVTHA